MSLRQDWIQGGPGSGDHEKLVAGTNIIVSSHDTGSDVTTAVLYTCCRGHLVAEGERKFDFFQQGNLLLA